MVALFNYPKRKLRKLLNKGEYKEALEFGKSIEDKLSNDSDFFFMMGSIYYMLGDANNAISYFDKSLAINDKDVETLLLKANVHLYLKEKDPAMDCCDKLLKIDPKNPEVDDLINKLEKI